jgi:hypothetical protein
LFSLGQGKDIPVATAVAASSAYPPFFSSVPVIIKNKLIANCIDGGVIDNHALAVARLMAKYVVNPERFVGGRTFSRDVGRLLAIDASAPMRLYERLFWFRLSTLLRLADVLHHRQVQDFEEAVDDIGRLFNVPAAAIGLRVPPGDDCALTNPEIARLAARARTHFDPFSNVECAVLAYLGYYWANQWAIEDYLGRKRFKPRNPNNVPMHGIGDILPTRFAPPAAMLTDSEMLAHLRYSHLRLRPWRWLRRCIARRFPFRR